MILSLLKIRKIQIFRALQSLGFIQLIFLLGILGYLLVGLYMQLASLPNAYTASGIYCALIFYMHVKRKDKNFIKINFENTHWIYFTEYLTLSIPVISIALFQHQWIVSALLVLVLFLIARFTLTYKQKNFKNPILQHIPYRCFEWRAGFRKAGMLMSILWLLGVVASFYIATVPILIYIIGLVILGFNDTNESLTLLLVFEKNAKKLLHYKIKSQLMLFLVFLAPLIVLFIVFHSQNVLIPLIELIILCSIQIHSIVIKYAFYEPNSTSEKNKVFEIFTALSLIIPFLIPVVWILIGYFYQRAIKNLTFYLDDYN